MPPADAVHAVVADLAVPHLDEGTLHHLARVRRLGIGARCTVTDGAGRWRACRFTGDAALEVAGEVVTVPRPAPPVTVAFALTKGAKPEWTVQKLSELGVDTIVPFRAARSVVRWDEDKAEANLARWCAIARGAVEQSHGCFLPTVEQLTDVASLARRDAVRLDIHGGPPDPTRPVVAVGPEGGWTDEERAMLTQSVRLSGNVLRAETAAVTAGALYIAMRSGIVLPPG